MDCGFWNAVGYMIQDARYKMQGAGFGCQDTLRFQVSGVRCQVSGCKIQGSRYKMQESGDKNAESSFLVSCILYPVITGKPPEIEYPIPNP